MTEQTISLERLEETINVFGSFDENIRIIEREMGVTKMCIRDRSRCTYPAAARSKQWRAGQESPDAVRSRGAAHRGQRNRLSIELSLIHISRNIR